MTCTARSSRWPRPGCPPGRPARPAPAARQVPGLAALAAAAGLAGQRVHRGRRRAHRAPRARPSRCPAPTRSAARPTCSSSPRSRASASAPAWPACRDPTRATGSPRASRTPPSRSANHDAPLWLVESDGKAVFVGEVAAQLGVAGALAGHRGRRCCSSRCRCATCVIPSRSSTCRSAPCHRACRPEPSMPAAARADTMAAVRIDLHVHSNASDGTDAPAEVVRRAARGRASTSWRSPTTTPRPGIAAARDALAARPDPGPRHGTVVPARRPQRAPARLPVRPGRRRAEAETEQIRDDRAYRAKAMVARARELGADVSWEQVTAIAGDAVIGRPHIARALAAAGAVADPGRRVHRRLDRRRRPRLRRPLRPRPGPRGRPGPGRGRRPGARPPPLARLRDLRRGHRGAGRRGPGGIEVFHPDHDAAERARLTELARSLGLISTGGSDDHGRSSHTTTASTASARRRRRKSTSGCSPWPGRGRDVLLPGVRHAVRHHRPAGHRAGVPRPDQGAVSARPGGGWPGRPPSWRSRHRRVRAVRTGDPDLHAGPDRRARRGGRAAAPAGLAAAADREDGRADLRRAREDQRGVRAARHAAARRARRDRGDDAVRPARGHRA